MLMRAAMSPGLDAALALRLESDEHHAGVRGRDEVHGIQARKLHDVGDARRVQRDLPHAAHHGIGAVDVCGLRQLQDREQVLLVLGRDVAAGHRAKADHGHDDQRGVDDEQSRRPADRAADAAGIAVTEALERRC